jgi:hypothetical protein
MGGMETTEYTEHTESLSVSLRALRG